MILLRRLGRADHGGMGALIVDDNEDMRSLVRILLDLDPELEVVAEAADACEAIAAWREHKPDAIVLDQRLPHATGLEIAEYILREDPGTPIVLFSAYLDYDAVSKAEELGVRACLSKDQVSRLPSLLAQHRRR
jgi:two-component system nitrate/nitrite response regulator NarL